jgi:TPP-dependent pyruvate/acetoin dehydrogenase alpha subunit
VCSHLKRSDLVTGSHRAHGLALAKGVPMVPLLSELLGRRGGLCGGRGGSMHIAHAESGFLGAFPVVGASVPLAVGAALSAKLRATGAVSVTFFGDGALNQGATLEALNLAAVWKVPVVFVLENNGWAETTSTRDAFAVSPLSRRAEAFGIEAIGVNGQRLEEVQRAAEWAIERARTGQGPTFIECWTRRFRGHHEGDTGGYRSQEEEAEDRQHDPLDLFCRCVGLSEEKVSTIETAVVHALESAVALAEAEPEPEPPTASRPDAVGAAR